MPNFAYLNKNITTKTDSNYETYNFSGYEISSKIILKNPLLMYWVLSIVYIFLTA